MHYIILRTFYTRLSYRLAFVLEIITISSQRRIACSRDTWWFNSGLSVARFSFSIIGYSYVTISCTNLVQFVKNMLIFGHKIIFIFKCSNFSVSRSFVFSLLVYLYVSQDTNVLIKCSGGACTCPSMPPWILSRPHIIIAAFFF